MPKLFYPSPSRAALLSFVRRLFTFFFTPQSFITDGWVSIVRAWMERYITLPRQNYDQGLQEREDTFAREGIGKKIFRCGKRGIRFLGPFSPTWAGARNGFHACLHPFADGRADDDDDDEEKESPFHVYIPMPNLILFNFLSE